MKRAFLTGITGQTGSYLAELLLEKGYEVHGLIRRASTFNTARIDHIFDQLHIYHGDLSDGSSLARLLGKIQPDEIYNLGAQSHVRVSFDCPEYTFDVGATGTLRLLEAIRETKLPARFYQASSSEMFGGTNCPILGYNESSPFNPRSPYACAKVAAYHLTVNYRESYGLHASNGILFNHESPRRGETFVTRKITRAIARICKGEQTHLHLGNLLARRDWGYAKEYAEAIWLMLQQSEPDDYVIATGESHNVREFLNDAFWHVRRNSDLYVVIDPRYFRPTEVVTLVGDATKAREKLGWKPKVKFKELVEIMVRADLEAVGLKDEVDFHTRRQ